MDCDIILPAQKAGACRVLESGSDARRSLAPRARAAAVGDTEDEFAAYDHAHVHGYRGLAEDS